MFEMSTKDNTLLYGPKEEMIKVLSCEYDEFCMDTMTMDKYNNMSRLMDPKHQDIECQNEYMIKRHDSVLIKLYENYPDQFEHMSIKEIPKKYLNYYTIEGKYEPQLGGNSGEIIVIDSDKYELAEKQYLFEEKLSKIKKSLDDSYDDKQKIDNIRELLKF
jgi:hypothetical protein